LFSVSAGVAFPTGRPHPQKLKKFPVACGDRTQRAGYYSTESDW